MILTWEQHEEPFPGLVGSPMSAVTHSERPGVLDGLRNDAGDLGTRSKGVLAER